MPAQMTPNGIFDNKDTYWWKTQTVQAGSQWAEPPFTTTLLHVFTEYLLVPRCLGGRGKGRIHLTSWSSSP